MRILVMGGSGLIGKWFCSEMREHGHRVIVLTRRPGQARLPEGVEACGWDGKTPEGWVGQVEQADALVNLAGENIGGGLWTAERKRRILQSRVDACRVLVQAVEKAVKKPEVVLQASAVGIYGDAAGKQLDETAAHGRGFMPDVVERWEAASQAMEDLGLRRIVMRSGLVLDPNEGVLPRLMLPFRLFAGGALGNGKQGVSWIHRTDQARAMRFLLENPNARGVYNFTAPGAVSNAQFGKLLARVMQRPYWMPAPAFALKLVLGEMSALLLEGQFVHPGRLLSEGYSFAFPQLEGALKDLLH